MSPRGRACVAAIACLTLTLLAACEASEGALEPGGMVAHDASVLGSSDSASEGSDGEVPSDAGSGAPVALDAMLPIDAGPNEAGSAGAMLDAAHPLEGGSTQPGDARAPEGDAGGPDAGDARAPEGPAPASCQRTVPDKSTPVIYVIGDSTASVYSQSVYPRMGWAQPLQDYFQLACAKIEDKALSGRSSKSFYDEGAWTPIKSALRPGDFVLIQFGHNDEKTEDAPRHTDPFGSYQQYLGRYIDDALGASATPILLTSIERNKWSGGKLVATHGDYPAAMRQLAAARKLTLIDMTSLTHAYFERLGQAATTKLFMNLASGEHPNYPQGNADDTHLQEKGARKVADIALAELARQRSALAALLDAVPVP